MRAVPLAAAGLAVLLLSACSPAQEPTPDPTTPAPVTTSATPTVDPTTPSPDPTTEPPTPTPSETLDPDQIAARDKVNEFFSVMNRISQDPEAPLQDLMDVTIGETQELFVSSHAEERDSNLIQVGDLEWSILEVGEVGARDVGKVVQVLACSDNARLDLVDQTTGVSVLEVDRPTIIVWEMDVVTDGPYWRVGDLVNSPGNECIEP